MYGVEKDRFITHKTNQWLVQSIQYFKPNKIYITDKTLLEAIEKISIEKTVELAEADLIVDRYTLENHTRILQSIKSMSNSQILLIASYSYSKSFFDELRKNPEITLVVDFYFGCLISKRTEQPKQNFFIRY